MIPNPVCNCCGCTIDFDHFSSGSLDPKWTTVSGTWTRDSGDNAMNSGGTGLIYDATTHPDGVGASHTLTLQYKFLDAGDNTFRFLMSYLDDDNYLYVEISRLASGCSEMQLGEVLATVDTPLGDPIPIDPQSLNIFYSITICYLADEGILRVNQSIAYLVGTQEAATGIGDKIGIQVVTGEGNFDAIFFSYSKEQRDTCEDCHAEDCILGDHTLSGTVDECKFDIISGTWGSGYVSTGAGVLKYRRGHPTKKTTMIVYVTVTVDGGEVVRVYANYADAANTHYAEFEHVSGTSFRIALYKSGVLLDERFFVIARGTGAQTLELTVCFSGTALIAIAVFPGVGISMYQSSLSTAVANGIYAGIGGDGGTSFTDFRLDKHTDATEPADVGCGECAEACGCDHGYLPLDGYTIDFGAATLTNTECDACDTVAGEFVVPFSTLGSGCGGGYSDNVCTVAYDGSGFCSPTCDQGGNFYLALRLGIESAGGGQLKFVLEVVLGVETISDPSCDVSCYKMLAEYESAAFDPDECNVVPVTLTKTVAEVASEFCDGSFPTTLTMDAA